MVMNGRREISDDGSVMIRKQAREMRNDSLVKWKACKCLLVVAVVDCLYISGLLFCCRCKVLLNKRNEMRVSKAKRRGERERGWDCERICVKNVHMILIFY
jgi:hypothetical protein